MTIWKSTVKSIVDHAVGSINDVDEGEVNEMIGLILKAKRVFLYGAGRSGLVAKAFATRLVHLDFTVYIVGETIAPSMNNGDLFIVITGSGETSSVIDYAKSVKKIGAAMVCVTSRPESTVGKMCDHIVMVKGRTKFDRTKFEERQVTGEHVSFAPLGTLFEDTVMLFFDGVIAELMSRLGKDEEQMRLKHATVE